MPWRLLHVLAASALAGVALAVLPSPAVRAQTPAVDAASYERPETRALVALVNDAADRVRLDGAAAFGDFRVAGSRWRTGETYIFVLTPAGRMIVHPDPALEGQNQLELRDVHGKAITRGLLDAVTTAPGRTAGWFHYQWPAPDGLLPLWKSTYVRLVPAPDGSRYVVGSGMYSDWMEPAFVVDAVRDAVGRLERDGTAAFPLLRDPAGPFLAKDSYVFVLSLGGHDLVNPAFPNLEGRVLLDVKDTDGRLLVREMIDTVRTKGSGWVSYMWPKPGESRSTQKSTYVAAARVGGETLLVGCGVYLRDASTTPPTVPTLTASGLIALVRSGAALLAEKGDAAYAQFRERGSPWFQGDTYLFVWSMDGRRLFHAADPAGEGKDVHDLRDVRGRPIGRTFLEAGDSPSGEGWAHYLYPEPGGLFPIWKSTFVKRVALPSGQSVMVGSGIYNMTMEPTFIEDVVGRAAALIEARGADAFPLLRDRDGPFVFMDTYVFVQTPDGTELVNPALPSLEGRNLLDLRDARGAFVVRDQIALAMRQGSGWLDASWFRPGDNRPARKLTYVRKVRFGERVFIVGSGLYVADKP